MTKILKIISTVFVFALLSGAAQKDINQPAECNTVGKTETHSVVPKGI